ncbi:methyltransferase domain-containing protein [bacterium]|nr:methyltransferase domain-containing protein [bacterium]
MSFWGNTNEEARQQWIAEKLSALPEGVRILDAGAGELRNRKHCRHLDYISQDFCQYEGGGNPGTADGAEGEWNTSKIDLVSDITEIPLEDESVDAILCSEVLEHVPEPSHALDEFSRLLRPGGTLILTAPFGSLVHQAPYHFCSGFSRFWYEEHLPARGLAIEEMTPNGDWFGVLRQEVARLGSFERQRKMWSWPLAYLLGVLVHLYGRAFHPTDKAELACFGWQCVAKKGAAAGGAIPS